MWNSAMVSLFMELETDQIVINTEELIYIIYAINSR
jgi:hypothetical protein